MVVVIGLIMLVAPAAAWSTSYSWSGPGYQSPFSSLGGFYSPYGMLGSSLGGLGSTFGYGSPFGYGSTFGSSPFSGFGNSYSTPATTSNSLFADGMFSDMGDTLGGSIFKNKEYGTPPEDAIKDTLVGENLTYNSGYMGIPLQYTIDESDIGAISGTQYQGEDAWKVRVGQAGIFWDVILDDTGTEVLKASQV
jgi:hypothetical protein